MESCKVKLKYLYLDYRSKFCYKSLPLQAMSKLFSLNIKNQSSTRFNETIIITLNILTAKSSFNLQTKGD